MPDLIGDPGPPCEPSSRGRRIDSPVPIDRLAELGRVASRIEKHIGDRIPNLARSPQNVQVESIREHGPASCEHAVHDARKSRTDRFHPTRKIVATRCLDDCMNVVALNRVMHDSEVTAVACCAKRSLELRDDPPRPQRRHIATHFQCDVTGMARSEGRATEMRIATDHTRLPSSPFATPTPSRRFTKIERELG